MIVLQIAIVILLCCLSFINGRTYQVEKDIKDVQKIVRAQLDYLNFSDAVDQELTKIMQEDKNNDA